MEGTRRILLVDDDAELLETLDEFLADGGFVVERAADGATALAKLGEFDPDLVLTDFEMPGMNGLELIHLIQARHPGLPILLVTARDDGSLFRAVDRAPGPVACLTKPLDLDCLTVVIRRLMGAGRVARASAHGAAGR
jgi:CheY-like chemotaxis protein